MTRQVHVFDNGVKVYDDHLIPPQRLRYAERNVHEADEEDIFAALVRSLPADGCFVNVGAAIGYYPILARRLAPGLAIYAVEPLRRHRTFLAENIRLNGFDAGDFIIRSEGFCAAAGTARLADKDFSSFIVRDGGAERKPSLLERLKSRCGIAAADGSVLITTTTLDEFIKEIARPVDLLQMDVQGLEREVLKGGTGTLDSGGVRTFLIGTHGAKIHRECVAILESRDYVIEFEDADPAGQPDGILVASKGVKRM